MTGVIRLNDEVKRVLKAARVDGYQVFLESGQLDRVLYGQVDKALRALGGKWNRKSGSHIFDHDPRAELGQGLETGEVIDAKKALGQFYTPADVASRMVDEAYLRPGLRILEPSCGDGRIIRAIAAGFPGWPADISMKLQGFELDMKTVDTLRQDITCPAIHIVRADFLNMEAKRYGQFDRILMNPPFNDAADIKHYRHALGFLKPGGVLVGICAGGPRQREFFDAVIADSNTDTGFWEDLPAGTFKDEGTNVSTALVMVRTCEVIHATMAPPIPRKMQDRATKPLNTAPLLDRLCG